MNYYPDFSQRLNQELQRQERSASWLAQRLDVSPSTVGRWLNDGTRPGAPEIVVQIADILGISAKRQTLLAAAGYGYIASDTEAPDQAKLGMTLQAAATAHVHAPPLPRPATPLIGRTQEQDDILAWMTDATTHLVTIMGPGGMGKTRLALAVAATLMEAGHFAHAVAFADLAPLTEVDQMPAAIAQALGLPLTSESDQKRSSEQHVIDFLQDRRLLLVLDNAEHLLDGADLVAAIVTHAPGIKVLITSRAPLRLPGEQIYPLHGLDYAKSEAPKTTEGSAASLFLQTARRVRPAFSADQDEQAAIDEICQLVEGMPLAIELAASWVTLMSAADILAAIRESLHFLETDLRGVPARHRSMEAVFDATWQRLSEAERRVFAQVSVFRGGFTQDAVRQVAGAELSQLRALAASTLIIYDQNRGRYGVHELLRQYGALRLADMPEVERFANQAHSDFYIKLLRQRQNALKSRALQTDLQVLDIEVDNLLRAWGWAAESGHMSGIIDTLDGLGLYLQWRGRADEGKVACAAAAEALRRAGEWQHLARALAWQALFARLLGRGDDAAACLAESLQRLDSPCLVDADIRAERAFALLQMGAAEAARDTHAAALHYKESLALYEALGEQWYAAEVLLGLGHISLTQGDFAGQRRYVQRALDTYRSLGNVRGTASALSMLADIDSYRGRLMSGLELGFEALAAFRSLGDPAGTATCLSRVGMTYMNLGDVTNARQVVEESLALFSEIGSRRDEVICHAFLCAIGLMTGDYWQAQTNAEGAVAIASELDDQFVLGVAVGFLGWSQHYTGNLDGALKTLREALTITTQTGAAMDSVRWHTQLGLVQWKQGQGRQARTHCCRALRLAVQVADPWSLLTAISSTVAILADGEDPERAVELHSMLLQNALCANSQWYVDGIGPHVAAAMACLPDDVVDAAFDRGKDLDQLAEAGKLVEEVSALGWDQD